MDEYDDLVKNLMKKPNPKARKLHNHFNISTPNELHQLDILHLPSDNKFMYALTLVDVASRYKEARPLRNKRGETIVKALDDIYAKNKHLSIPIKINTDKGSEFVNKWFREYCEQNDIIHIVNEPSNHLSFVENFNRELAKAIFKRQHKEEIKNGKLNKKWTQWLINDVLLMNNKISSMIKMKPVDAIKLTEVEQPKNDFTKADIKKSLPLGTAVRRLLNKDEILNVLDNKITVEKRRSTDPYWSLDIYEITSVIKKPDALALHRIADADANGVIQTYPHLFTYWQLQKVT